MERNKIGAEFICPSCGGELILSLEDIKIDTLVEGAISTTHNESHLDLYCPNEDCNKIRFEPLFFTRDIIHYENALSVPIWRLIFDYSIDLEDWEESQQVILRAEPLE